MKHKKIGGGEKNKKKKQERWDTTHLNTTKGIIDMK